LPVNDKLARISINITDKKEYVAMKKHVMCGSDKSLQRAALKR
jgi:hypothetical protein